jgi:hypothetical protein
MLESKDTEHVPEAETGMAAWIGTAVHAHIEDTLELPGAVQETKVDIFEIPGYGWIRGHIDMCWKDSIWDWKVQGKWKIDKQKLTFRKDSSKIPDTTYRVQLHLYGYGRILQGHTVETVNLVSIPKMSNSFNDIMIYSEPYNQKLVDDAIDRAKRIWQYCVDGRVEELPADKDCYTCNNS